VVVVMVVVVVAVKIQNIVCKMFILIMRFSSNFSWLAISSVNSCSLNFACKSYSITGLEGSKRLQFPQFLGSRHMNAVRLSALNT